MKSTTESGRDVPVSGQSAAKVPALYQGFDGQYIVDRFIAHVKTLKMTA